MRSSFRQSRTKHSWVFSISFIAVANFVLFTFNCKLPFVRFRLAIPAAHLIVGDIPSGLPDTQGTLTVTVATLLLAHLAVLLLGELIGQQLQQVLRPRLTLGIAGRFPDLLKKTGSSKGTSLLFLY